MSLHLLAVERYANESTLRSNPWGNRALGSSKFIEHNGVDEWTPFTEENFHGEMDIWLGSIMTVYCVGEDFVNAHMVEDGHQWFWNEYCIDYIVLDSSEFQEAGEDELMGFLLN